MKIINKVKEKIMDFVEYQYFRYLEKQKQQELENLVDEYLYYSQQ